MKKSELRKIIKEEMKFDAKEGQQQFLHNLEALVDEYHASIYLLEGVFEGVEMIKNSINK